MSVVPSIDDFVQFGEGDPWYDWGWHLRNVPPEYRNREPWDETGSAANAVSPRVHNKPPESEVPQVPFREKLKRFLGWHDPTLQHVGNDIWARDPAANPTIYPYSYSLSRRGVPREMTQAARGDKYWKGMGSRDDTYRNKSVIEQAMHPKEGFYPRYREPLDEEGGPQERAPSALHAQIATHFLAHRDLLQRWLTSVWQDNPQVADSLYQAFAREPEMLMHYLSGMDEETTRRIAQLLQIIPEDE